MNMQENINEIAKAAQKYSNYAAKIDIYGQLVRDIELKINPESEIGKTSLKEVFKDALQDLPMIEDVIKDAEDYRSDLIQKGHKQSEAMIKAVFYVSDYFNQIEQEYEKRLNTVVRERVFIVKSPFVFNHKTGKYEYAE